MTAAAMRRERRSLGAEVRYATTGLEVRDSGDGTTFTGYASRTGTPYDVNDWMGTYAETIVPGAFRSALDRGDDVRLLINHDGLPLARSASGTLRLSEDSTGLHVEARLDPTDPDVAALAPKMRRGDVDQMSFGFRALRQKWSTDYNARDVLDVELFDVSVVTYPASPTTTAALRSGGIDPERLCAVLEHWSREARAGRTLSSASVALVRTARASIDAAEMSSEALEQSLEAAEEALTGLLVDAGEVPPPDADDDGAERAMAAEREARRRAAARLRLLTA